MSGPLRIAHVSDPHFGTEVPVVRDALHADLLAASPDLLLVTGDITQRARRAQFAAARDFLAALPMRNVCLPGNHDLPLFDLFTRVLRPYERFRHYLSASLEPEFIDARLAVLCVDATSPRRHKDGRLDAGQVARTATRLRGLPQPFRLVATHQPLASTTRSDRRNVAHGAQHALASWIGAGADLFLGGHIHLPFCLPVGTADGRRSSLLLQAGTCISHRTRPGVPNSYNMIELHHDQGRRHMRFEQRDFDAASGRFLPRARHVAVSAMRGPQDDSPGWEMTSEEIP